ncbi:MAG: vWA domain-containing protein [Pseudomonadota bacterium]|nr:vWA domain-containing protein [Pseudomonadota bacterium]
MRGLAFVLLALFGCGQTDLVPVPGTTVRVAPPKATGQGKAALELHIFHTEEECNAAVKPEDVKDCLPYVDRASGQVRVAFQTRVDGDEWSIPDPGDNIEIFHKNQRVMREGRKDFLVVPHDPKRSEQIFVLMIDATYSMGLDDEGNGVTRLEKVKRALLRADVVDAFFPGDVQTSVVPLIFRGGRLPEPLLGKWIVDNKKDYRQIIKDGLNETGGFTPLYEAIEFSATTALEVDEVKKKIKVGKQAPTVIVLTDGFNNPLPADTCADNAPRLEKLLKSLDGIRRGENSDVRDVPTVYTVGLGRSAWRGFEVPDTLSVSARDICKGFAQQLINGGVEMKGVDNAALSWIARVGGGASFISRTTDGLAEAFKAAAAVRYRWFEARYKVDPFYLRRSFETKLRLSTMLRSEGTVWIHPSGWLDAPPGIPGPDGWARAAPFRETTTVLLPLLGLIAALGYVPAAWFNVRRALFSRVARRRKSK